MNESSTTYHHSISLHSNSIQQLKNARVQTSHDESIMKNIKDINDDINKNIKDLEHFYYMNIKLKKMINELIQFYFINDQENMTNRYKTIREILKKLQINMTSYNDFIAKYSKKTLRKCTASEFNSLFEEKRRENSDFSRKHNNSGKYSFCLFKRFITSDNDQILRDLFKDDVRATIVKNAQFVMGEKIDEITYIMQINKRHNQTMILSKKLPSTYTFLVNNSFQIILKFESESSIKFKINVFALDEYANFSEFASLSNYSLKKEYFHSNVKRRVIVDEKSKYSLFRKISKLFEDRINLITKLSPARMLTKPQTLQIFCWWLQNYNDLFKKKCFHCKNISKFNKLENNFYPPYYKVFDLETDNFFHEECFNLINNNQL